MCYYNTKEITSYRRYLKLIKYVTYGGFVTEDKTNEGIYLDDFEDSRKINKSENQDKNFVTGFCYQKKLIYMKEVMIIKLNCYLMF